MNANQQNSVIDRNGPLGISCKTGEAGWKPQHSSTPLLRSLAILILVLTTAVAQAQTFTTLKSFGILTNVTGFYPDSTLVQGPDGTLYGTANSGEGSVWRGTVFKMQPDGSGFTSLKLFTNYLEGSSPSGGVTLSGNVLYGTAYSGGTSNYGTVFSLNTDGTGFTVLKNFSGSDGANPYYAALTVSGNVLYGTTYSGGASGYGTVFSLNTDGTGFTVLKDFAGSDGANPNAGLTLSGGVLYGTTEHGGSSGYNGTVFALNTDGTGYTVLCNFTNFSDGAYPDCVLTLSGSALYGTTYGGGSNYYGTVFTLNTDGTGYTVLKHLDLSDGVYPGGPLALAGTALYGTTTSGGSIDGLRFGTLFKVNTDGTGFTVLKSFTNSPDGANPYGGVLLSGSVLYGTTSGGGSSSAGTVFKLNTDGSGYTVLKNFTGSDGSRPYFASLTLSGSTLYGATYYGGTSNSGTLFKLNTDGTGFSTLYSFTYVDTTLVYPTNSDGGNPNFGLTLSGNVLYGTAENGGTSGYGTLFKVNTDGTGFAVLKAFSSSPDGAYPDGVLMLSGDTLYGTTYRGGSLGYGTIYKITTNGTGYTMLKNLDHDNDGANPTGALLLSGGVLYGTAAQGGLSSYGVVFKMSTDGSGYTVLKNFSGWPLDGAAPIAGLTLSGSALYGTTGSGGTADNGTLFRLNADGTGYGVVKNFAFEDGVFPEADLVLSDNVLYGTTHNGGSGGSAGGGNGTVFKINTDGTGFAILHPFTPGGFFSNTNSDGFFPSAGLVVSGSALYGTAYVGGSSGNGTVFAVNTDGTGFTALYSFTSQSYNNYTNQDGTSPQAGLVLAGDTLYGTAHAGGSGDSGTLFAVNTDGTGFTTLHTFTGSDGSAPRAKFILLSNVLYGTTSEGGSAGNGTVFAVNTDGTGFTTLHSFTANAAPGFTNSDGAHPQSGLVLSGNTLYGTAISGGDSGRGTVFAVNTDGTGFATLHSFTSTPSYPNATNSDGAHPQAGLILSGSTLYGTAYNGGAAASGTVFAVNTDGTGFTTLHNFMAVSSGFPEINSDGAYPLAGLVLSGNALYGTTDEGGSYGYGTVFSISFRPHLTITHSGLNIILTWPTNVDGFDYSGYSLESTTNLVPPVVWNTNFPTPVVVNGQYTVTNPISGAQKFYRLIQ